MASDKPTTNDQTLRCQYCDSLVLSKGLGAMVYDRSIDIPLMVQKRAATSTEKQLLTLFCGVKQVHEFDNVGVTRSHEGRVYLTCADCEMGPIGLHDPDSNKFLVALDRVKLVS